MQRFLVDMPLSPVLAEWLRTLGHEAVHATELSMHDAPHIAILDRAAEDRRVIVTADLDFPRLLAILNAEGLGLILLRGGDYNDTESIDCVRRVLMAIPEPELSTSVVVVDRKRVRRRWLPI